MKKLIKERDNEKGREIEKKRDKRKKNCFNNLRRMWLLIEKDKQIN